MSDVLVVSGAYTTDESRWRIFKQSCERHEVPFHVLGVGATSYSAEESLGNVIAFLETREERYIVLTDSYDVIVNRWDERELKYIIDSAPDLVMSVETNIWPDGPWVRAYSHLEGYLWKGICGGQYCGSRDRMLHTLRDVEQALQMGRGKLGCSQEILHEMFKEKFVECRTHPFALDLRCEIFQSMLGPHATEIIDAGDIAWNKVTRSRPMFLHFNGQGQDLSFYHGWARKLGYE